MEIFITAIKCNNCNDTIFSRAQHDFHRCTCERVFVDGGNQMYEKVEGNIITGYQRAGFHSRAEMEFTQILLGDFPSIESAQKYLFDDWNGHTDKEGVVHGS